jgi:phosphate transport system substrate-binding protein
MADLTHPRLAAAIVAAFIAVTVIWFSISILRWRRITWREHMDTQVATMPKEARESGPWAMWKVLTHHEEVTQPSMVLLRIRNSGLRRITRPDVLRPLTFTFPDRVVKEFTVTDCRGVSRQEIQPPGDLNSPQAVENTITLPSFPMGRRAGFRLLVLLSGPGRSVDVNGGLRRGSVRRESPGRGPLTRNIAFGSVLLLLVGVQAGITFSQGAALPTYCASGKLALEGSTAFAPTARVISAAYTSVCRGASISVAGIATFNGLNAVASQNGADPPSASGAATKPQGGNAAGVEQIAMSDGSAPNGYDGLYGNRVAVIEFAVVVNKETNVYNLTTVQLQDIFTGKVTNWDQVGGRDLPISIVARTTASGTRRTFDVKILGGKAEPPFTSYNCTSKNAVPSATVTRCEVADTPTLLSKVNSISGAIGYAQISDASTYTNRSVSVIKINGQYPTDTAVKLGSYPYWTVEYLYTAGRPIPGSLAADFITYMNSETADVILLGSDYIPCIDGKASLLQCTEDG